MAPKSKHFKVMNYFPNASVGQVSIPADGGININPRKSDKKRVVNVNYGSEWVPKWDVLLAPKPKHFKVMNNFSNASVGQVSIPAD